MKKGTGSEPKVGVNLGGNVDGSVPVPFFNGAAMWSVRKRGQLPVVAAVLAASEHNGATEPVPFPRLALTV